MLHSEIQVGPPSKVCQIVEVCALLHNICKARNIILPEEEEHLAAAEDGGNEERPPAQKVQSRHEGILYRDEFVVTQPIILIIVAFFSFSPLSLCYLYLYVLFCCVCTVMLVISSSLPHSLPVTHYCKDRVLHRYHSITVQPYNI
ncbi:uncharacterized protein LOC123500558 [Portunus trituberculatus]|uniref:uncharacterized protein LOC123500558 n=1 Tax=Portunus trituberculatus TaxID=210409 RepID=UPI001E1CC814|nr:uncharacterized protein LOC123500558 [Portunus trituberculatus]